MPKLPDAVPDDFAFYQWYRAWLDKEPHPAIKTAAKAAWFAARESALEEAAQVLDIVIRFTGDDVERARWNNVAAQIRGRR